MASGWSRFWVAIAMPTAAPSSRAGLGSLRMTKAAVTVKSPPNLTACGVFQPVSASPGLSVIRRPSSSRLIFFFSPYDSASSVAWSSSLASSGRE